jgi:Ca-activated chloride channel family protein
MSRFSAGPTRTLLRLSLLTLLTAAATVQSFASQRPAPTTAAPAGTPVLIARADEDERGAPLQIGSAEVQVTISGFLARTTTTLTFENKTNRTLEGELVFPLPEGATISGYGLDLDGQIVDAVVVKAQAARVAFEQEVRRGIDPGLVEWVRGSSFRTRVWPVPAAGRRTVRIEYVSELTRDAAGVIVYQLPLRYSLPLPTLALRIEVLDPSARPEVQASRLANFRFASWEGRLVASTRLQNQPLSDDIRVAIPPLPEAAALVETHTDGRTYFAIDDVVAFRSPPAATKPHRVGLLWDASFSHARADSRLELEVIKAWLASLGDVEVVLTVFRNVTEPAQTIVVRRGNAAPVLAALQREPNDGATNLAALRPSRGVDYYVLVSDGLGNVGRGLPEGLGAPIYALTGASGADQTVLRHLAQMSGGRYIPLGALTPAEAALRIGRPPAGTLWLEFDQSALADVLPARPQPVDERVRITGRLLVPEAPITLRYRAASGATSERRFILRRTGAAPSGLVPRFWAGRKVAELAVVPDRHADELVALGMAFGIVTPGTSLLVLETVVQYLRHGIEPPETRPGLRAEYRLLAAERGKTEAQTRGEKLERIAAMWRDRVTWWEAVPKGPFPTKPRTPTPTPARQAVAEAAPTTPQAPPQPPPSPRSPQRIDCLGAPSAVEGRVTDPGGAAIPGATVTATDSAGSAATVTTDADGVYRLCRLPRGSYRLQVDLPGFRPWQRRVELPAARAVNVRLEVGALTETVEVAAEPLAAETSAGVVRSVEAGPQGASSSIEIKPWDPDTPYLAAIKGAGAEKAYATYLAQRDSYAGSPSFSLDCAEHFLARGDRAIGLRVLTAILDLKIEDPRLLRVVAHRLQQLGELDLAIALFEDVLRLRPEEPQSFRDLALALAERADACRAAKCAAAQLAEDYLRSLDLLDKVVLGQWDDRFPEIETAALMDANRLLAIMEREKLPGIERVTLDPRLRRLLDVDLRIILTWDTDETDMDLWVTEPTDEKCDYSHNRTVIGGLLSHDFTAGYGPEEYLLRRAPGGKYAIQANFYGTRDQSLTGPTTAQATVITNFGRPDESRRTLTLRLTEEKEAVDIGSVRFDPNGKP